MSVPYLYPAAPAAATKYFSFAAAKPATTDERVTRSVLPSLARGLYNSPSLRTLTVAVFLGALGAGILFVVVASPPLWMIIAVVGGGIGVGLLLGAGIQKKGKQKLAFECSTIQRLFKNQNYNPIIKLQEQGCVSKAPRILLGALPNMLGRDGEHLVDNESIGAVLSINEPWERDPIGLSSPYQKADWEGLGVEFYGIDARDHTLLDDAALDSAADFIHDQVQKGKSVYVHCRAGVGRSAMAIAAYLMKYRGFTFRQACDKILEGRSISTIEKKAARLLEFEARLTNLNHAQLSELAENAAGLIELGQDVPQCAMIAYEIKRLNGNVDALVEEDSVSISGKLKEVLRHYEFSIRADAIHEEIHSDGEETPAIRGCVGAAYLMKYRGMDAAVAAKQAGVSEDDDWMIDLRHYELFLYAERADAIYAELKKGGRIEDVIAPNYAKAAYQLKYLGVADTDAAIGICGGEGENAITVSQTAALRHYEFSIRADAIHDGIQAGVQQAIQGCVGAAYLMKHCGMDLEEACKLADPQKTDIDDNQKQHLTEYKSFLDGLKRESAPENAG